MYRKLRFFRQHTLETCGISCILMVLYRYRRVQYPTAKQERKLYALYRCRAFKGVLPAAAADCLSRNGLKTLLCHSSPDLLENRGGYFPEAIFRPISEEYRETLEQAGDGIDVRTGCRLTPDWYREQLASGRLIMAQCIVPGDADGLHDHVLHWILVYGCDEDGFLACDPLSHKFALSAAELEHYTDTPLGRIALVIWKED